MMIDVWELFKPKRCHHCKSVKSRTKWKGNATTWPEAFKLINWKRKRIIIRHWHSRAHRGQKINILVGED